MNAKFWGMNMKRHTLVLAAALVLAGPARAALPPLPTRGDPCQYKPPMQVRQVLQQRYPSWHIFGLANFSDFDRSYWMKHHPDWCPGATEGEFSPGSGREWAVTLVRHTPKAGWLQMLVLIDSKKKITVMMPPEAAGLLSTISRLPPGRYEDYQTGKKVTVPFDCILFEAPEAGSGIFFENRSGRIHSIQLSD